MAFNATKCHVMTIHRGRNALSHMYELCGVFLSHVTQEKYLGVLISNNLSWEPHISSTASKASQKLGFLKRNLINCPPELKRLAYISTVRSSLEYASIVWDPAQSNHKSALEGVQRRAARWISSDYGRQSSVTGMMAKLGLETLEDRRRNSRLIFLYKILNDKVAIEPLQLDLQKNPRAVRGLSTQDKLLVNRCNTNQLKCHFSARTVPEWNKLPQKTTSADSVPTFKSQLTGKPRPSQ